MDLIKKVIEDLEGKKISYVDDVCTKQQFDELTSYLGEVICPTYIEISKNNDPVKPLIKTPTEIFFHNDDLGAELIGWYCVEESQYNEPVLIMDSLKVLEHLNQSDIETLKTIYSDSETEYFCPHTVVPLMQEYGLYFPPLPMLQGTLKNTEEEKLNVLNKLYEVLLQMSEEEDYHKFHLRKGQILIVDNRKYLHSRADLHADSRRKHLRVWVNEKQ